MTLLFVSCTMIVLPIMLVLLSILLSSWLTISILCSESSMIWWLLIPFCVFRYDFRKCFWMMHAAFHLCYRIIIIIKINKMTNNHRHRHRYHHNHHNYPHHLSLSSVRLDVKGIQWNSYNNNKIRLQSWISPQN